MHKEIIESELDPRVRETLNTIVKSFPEASHVSISFQQTVLRDRTGVMSGEVVWHIGAGNLVGKGASAPMAHAALLNSAAAKKKLPTTVDEILKALEGIPDLEKHEAIGEVLNRIRDGR